ncbi:VOC family protein [Gordonia soli]
MMFVNLAVADVDKARDFFTRAGFSFDEMFCDPGTLCMTINEKTKVMLLHRRRFAGYSAGPVADPDDGREVLLALEAGSRAEVDRRVDAALEAGATELRPGEDLGFLYTRTFRDLDGHGWEVLFMDPGAIPQDADS